ncbi:hypothetical protein GG344DRAFT_82076 [Lentinula edodes]|nr:hypothetical protein GG344DRAFT_82076 [Lentinula edodes]
MSDLETTPNPSTKKETLLEADKLDTVGYWVYIPQWTYFMYVCAVSTPPYLNFKHRWGIGLFLYQAFDTANGFLSLSVFLPLRSFISVLIPSPPSSINLNAYPTPMTGANHSALKPITSPPLRSSFGITPGFTDTLACADGFDDAAFKDNDVPSGEREVESDVKEKRS